MWISGSRQLVDHPLVQLGLLAVDLEEHLLARGDGSGRGSTRRNRSKSGPIGTIRVSSTPFCKPSETRPRLWIASDSALSCSRASRISAELVLDRAEVLAEPADLRRPAVGRAAGGGGPGRAGLDLARVLRARG